MALITRQDMIWDGLERELPPGLREVREFLEELSRLDEPLVRALEIARGHGRDDYPVRAMWNTWAVSLYLRRGQFQELLDELGRNGDLARLLGFQSIGSNLYRTPTASAMSRFRTHGKPQRKARDGGQETPSTDPQASYSVKTKRWEDAQGRVREEKKSTFGYKLYAVSDCEIPAVLVLETVTGSTSDQTMVGRMLDELGRVFEPGAIETLSMDKGFDSEDSIRSVYSRRILPVVPVRDVPRDLDQLPPEDREVRVEGTDNIVRDRCTGEVACYDTTGESPRREPMVYAGFEADRGTHRFRCPLRALGQTCPAQARCGAGKAGRQGRQGSVRE